MGYGTSTKARKETSRHLQQKLVSAPNLMNSLGYRVKQKHPFKYKKTLGDSIIRWMAWSQEIYSTSCQRSSTKTQGMYADGENKYSTVHKTSHFQPYFGYSHKYNMKEI